MEFNDLTQEEQQLFLKIIKKDKGNEVFLMNGDNYFPLLKKGLIVIIPNGYSLSALILLTHKGKKMEKEIVEENFCARL